MIAHDMSPGGRLEALLEACKTHMARGDFRHMPQLENLVAQTDRIVRAAIGERMDARQIAPQRQPQPLPEMPL